MNYAILTGNTITATGTAEEVWPGVSHPSTGPADDWLAERNAVKVRSDLPHNPQTHYLRRVDPYLLGGEVFDMEAVELEPEIEPMPEPRWVEFGAAIAADTAVNQMIGAAAQAAPVLHLMLGVGLGQAAQGDARTFSTAWANAIAVGLVAPTLAAHVADMAASLDLPLDFIANLNLPTTEP